MRDRFTACGAALFALAALLPAPARALDLEQALRDVAAANPTVAARTAMVEAARRRIAPAGAWRSPMLMLGLNNVPTTGRLNTQPMTMKMIELQQRVPVFGSNRLAASAATEALDETTAGAEVTDDQVFGAAWDAYASAYRAERMAARAEEHRGLMDRLVEAARARYTAGTGRLEDVLRADAERARVLADLAGFQSNAEAARAGLDALRGRTPGSDPDTLAAPPNPPVPADPAVWTAAVDATHPRLRELDARVQRFRFAARAARRMTWPDLQLRAAYGARETLANGMPQDDMFSVSVGLMLPLFAGSNQLSTAAEKDAMADAAEAQRHAAQLELDGQVRSVHAAARAAARTVRLLADTVVVTQQRALEASWSSYTAGGTDLWRVFEAAHALYEEEIALERARLNLARAQARLIALTGRGDLLGVALPETRRNER